MLIQGKNPNYTSLKARERQQKILVNSQGSKFSPIQLHVVDLCHVSHVHESLSSDLGGHPVAQNHNLAKLLLVISPCRLQLHALKNHVTLSSFLSHLGSSKTQSKKIQKPNLTNAALVGLGIPAIFLSKTFSVLMMF